MCGIAGYLRFDSDLPRQELQDRATRMARTMVHRGPDDEGVWVDPAGRCALAHRRLSIIDTSAAGRQPMSSADGGSCIVFNGEIYNYQELRPELERAGRELRTRTDTEVLIESLRLWGTEALPRLDGMYAFGLLDVASGELLLARDPFGEKPLYYIEGRRDFAFASELHALQTIPGFDDTVELGALAEYFCLQYVDAPRSFYRGVRKLPPGHWLHVDRAGRVTTGRHFSFEPDGEEGAGARSLDALADELEEILLRAIRRRLIADVPLGAFLSGGIDSSTVVALITRRLGLPIRTFSIGFEDSPASEHVAARVVSRHLGTEHHDEVLRPEVAALLPELGARMDEPHGDASCMPTYLLSRMTRRHVTVAISGDGGDEMFGGYNRYRAALGAARRTTPGDAYYSGLALLSSEDQIRELIGFVPRSLRATLQGLRREVDWSAVPLLSRFRRTDVEHYLPGAVLAKVDRMSMQHSLEVRTPFLSREVAAFAERLPQACLIGGGIQKRLLRHLAARYLPRAIVGAPKKGFGLPMRKAWDAAGFVGRLAELVRSPDSPLGRCLGSAAVERFIARHEREANLYQLSAMITLEAYLRHRPASLPRLERGSPLGEMLSPHPGNPSTRLLVQQLERRGAPVLLACEREVPQWALDLPAGSRIVSPLPIDAEATTAAVRWDWRDAAAPAPASLLGPGAAEGAARPAGLVLFDRDASFPIEPTLLGLMDGLGIAELYCCDGDRWSRFRLPTADERRRRSSLARRRLGRVLLRLILWSAGAPVAGRRAPWLVRLPLAAGWWLGRSLPKRWTDWLPQPLHRLYGFRHRGGYGYEVKHTYSPWARRRDFCDRYILYEDAKPLLGPGAAKREVRQLGGGRYAIVGRRVLFSASDGSDPNRNGRAYFLLSRGTGRGLRFQSMFADLAACDLPRVESFGQPAANEAELQQRLAEYLGRAVPAAREPSARIALVTNALGPGGTERQVTNLAVELKRAGHPVFVVTVEPPTERFAHYLPFLERHAIPVFCGAAPEDDAERALARADREGLELLAALPPRLQPRVWDLFRLMERIDPEYVHCQLDVANIAGGLAAALAGVPRILLSVRSLNPTHPARAARSLEWCRDYYRALAASSRVVLSANSRAGIEDHARWLGLDPARFVLIRNGLGRQQIEPPAAAIVARTRAELGLEPGARVVLAVQRLSAEKQPMLFLDLVEGLRQRQPALRALLAGDGTLEDRVRARLERRGLKACLQLLGRRADVPVLIALADVVVLTSRLEGTPNVLLEAQALGVPVVTTDAGGTSEALLDGVTGYVCRSNRAEELAERCQAILADADLRREMGQAGRRFVEETFGIERCVAETLAALSGRVQSRPLSRASST